MFVADDWPHKHATTVNYLTVIDAPTDGRNRGTLEGPSTRGALREGAERTGSKGLTIYVGCLWPTLLTFGRMFRPTTKVCLSGCSARLAIKSLTVAVGLVLVEVLGPHEPRPTTPHHRPPTPDARSASNGPAVQVFLTDAIATNLNAVS